MGFRHLFRSAKPRAADSRDRHFRPNLETLEGRETPANFTVSFSAVTHTLTIVGDSLNNNLSIAGNLPSSGYDPTVFELSSTTDTFNTYPGPFVSESGVENITIRLGDGNDNVTFTENVWGTYVRGNLSIQGGAGANSVMSTDLSVVKNFTITNGTNSDGTDVNTFVNPSIGGTLRINNGNGDTDTTIGRSTAGNSVIAGGVSITNGSGSDGVVVRDVDIGGNVTVNNGRGNSSTGLAGYTQLHNYRNTGALSTILGNVSVSYLTGNGAFRDGIWDMNVVGNVTFNHGSGSFTTNFDGLYSGLPVQIHGNLTLRGTGSNTIAVGTVDQNTGLVVGKNFTVASGSVNDTLTFSKLEVNGATRLALGNGANSVKIDDSVFFGTFYLATGAGGDSLNLEATAGTTAPTRFYGTVLIYQGAGNDTFVRAGLDDFNQTLHILGKFTVHHGAGQDTHTFFPLGHEFYLFSTSIVYIA